MYNMYTFYIWSWRLKRNKVNRFSLIKTNEKQFLKLIFLFLLLNIYFQSISFSFAQTESLDNVDFIGKVYVSDGDTVKSKNNKVKIILHGIDAPEAKQTCQNFNGKKYSCGYKSTAVLTSLINQNQIKCKFKDKDK